MAGGKAQAFSASTHPTESVSPVVVAAIREVGIDISHQKPQRLTTEMIKPADRVITMGCGVEGTCPANFVATEDWGFDDPKGQPLAKIRGIRDEIRARVVKMLEEMS